MDVLPQGPPSASTADSPSAVPARRQLTPMARTMASLALAAGLLAVGGVAIANAASPDPSASTTSPAPAASGAPGGSGGTNMQGNCPNM
jgi:hypothetical protein